MKKDGSRQARMKMGKLERKNTLIAYSFLAPNFLGFAIFTLVPVLCAVALSFFEWNVLIINCSIAKTLHWNKRDLSVKILPFVLGI